ENFAVSASSVDSEDSYASCSVSSNSDCGVSPLVPPLSLPSSPQPASAMASAALPAARADLRIESPQSRVRLTWHGTHGMCRTFRRVGVFSVIPPVRRPRVKRAAVVASLVYPDSLHRLRIRPEHSRGQCPVRGVGTLSGTLPRQPRTREKHVRSHRP